MSEVVDEIVNLLTEPRFMGKMVVIMAGYEREIEDMLAVNPGLKSRVTEKLHFPDFTSADACKLFNILLKKEDLSLTPETEEALPGMMERLISAPGWSNGRDVTTWSKRVYRQVAQRYATSGGAGGGSGAAMALVPEDLEASLNDFLATKTSSKVIT
jgi:hypothetical protein